MPSIETVRRFDILVEMLSRPEGVSVADAARRIGVSRHVVTRLLGELRDAGEPIVSQRDGMSVRHRVQRAGPDKNLLSLAEIFALELARRSLGYLKGTGILGYLEGVCERIYGSVDGRRKTLVKQLDQKIVWLDDTPTRYDDVTDTVDAIISGLVYNRALRVTYRKGSESRTFRLDPYSLVVHKRGLYVLGYSHHRNEQRKFALDAITAADPIPNVTFQYPVDYDPARDFEDSFGIFTGPLVDVRVRFDPEVARYVLRRRWHATELFVTAQDGSVEMRLRVAGTVELKNSLLSYGDSVEVLEPPAFRDEFAAITARMAQRHARPLDAAEPP